jgi:hypothetical protein
VDKNGNPPEHANQRLYDKYTGRLVQDGLSQFVKMFPTPDANCGNRGPAKDPAATHRPSGAQRQMTINDAVKMWPTPTSISPAKNGYNEAGNSCGLVAIRKRISDEDSQATGQLNPMWVEWLMGFPLGWTDLEDSETP